MMAFAILLALWSPQEIPELDKEVETTASRRFVMRRPGTVDVSFENLRGNRVRIVLVRSRLESLYLEDDAPEIAATDFAASGRLRIHLDQPAEYSIILDNRLDMRPKAIFRTRGLILYDVPPSAVRTLSPERQFGVISASLACFLAVCVFGGRRLWRAVTAPRTPEPPLPLA